MSSNLSEDQVRYLVLKTLYENKKKNPTSDGMEKGKLIELKIPENSMEFNILYLRDKGLVKLFLYRNTIGWWAADITALGIDVIEHKDTYKSSFSFVNTTIQVQGNNYGNIAQAVNGSGISFNQEMSNAFKKAYEIIEMKKDISIEQKDTIRKNTSLLEEELQKTEPDAGKIQQSWKWLKRNADWLVPTLVQVVLDGINIACGVK